MIPRPWSQCSSSWEHGMGALKEPSPSTRVPRQEVRTTRPWWTRRSFWVSVPSPAPEARPRGHDAAAFCTVGTVLSVKGTVRSRGPCWGFGDVLRPGTLARPGWLCGAEPPPPPRSEERSRSRRCMDCINDEPAQDRTQLILSEGFRCTE